MASIMRQMKWRLLCAAAVSSAAAAQEPDYVAVKAKAMRRIRKFLNDLWTDENAISSVEYALLLAFVAAGIIVAADALSNAVSNEMDEAANCINAETDAEIALCG